MITITIIIVKITKMIKIIVIQACHSDLTQNLNECEKKYEYTEKNLNLTTKIELL